MLNRLACRLALVALLLAALSLNLPAGTLTGTITSANTSVPLQNATLTLTPSQAAYIAGSFAITGDPVSCFTSIDGSVVGLRNPLLPPVVTPSTASGTLPAATYYTVITYWNASGQTMVSPEAVTLLSGPGNLLVAAPSSQPANATGYKVSISTTSGTETLQSSVTGWSSYTQSSSLAAGAAIPASNSTVCSVRFNDEMIPTRTKYNVILRRSDGSTVSGWPQRWTLQGGSAGSINLSNGYPYSVGDVIYPEPLLLTPPTNAQQSVNSPVTFNNYNVKAGSFISQVAIGTAPFQATSTTADPNLTVSSLTPALTLRFGTPRTYNVADVGGVGDFLVSPRGTNAANTLDCTVASVICLFSTKATIDIASCNAGVAGGGLDNFASSAPTPECIIGSNVIKGGEAFAAALSYIQHNEGANAAATTVTTTYPAATVSSHLLIAVVGVYGGAQTVSGCTDTTNAYTLAVRQQNGTSASVEIWYFLNSTGKAAASTLTCTLSGAQNASLNWYEYDTGGFTTTAFDKSGSATGTGSTTPTATVSAPTTQATELVIGAFAATGNQATVTPAAAFYVGSTKNNGSNGTSAGEATIIQATGSPTAAWTIGTSANWSAAVATFKVPSVTNIQGQRSWQLPDDYPAASPLSFTFKYDALQVPAATANVAWAIAASCTADGSTDDPPFNTASTVSSPVATSPAAGGAVTSVTISNVSMAGCSPGNEAHFAFYRQLGVAGDTFAGRARMHPAVQITYPRAQ